ncbi:hypothetical protein B0H10DRAFT_2050614, partial [Mycena sp. CBHHK59/15]
HSCVWRCGSHKWLGNSVQITGMKFSPGWLNSGQNPATLYHTHMANILVEAFQLFLSKFLLSTRRCRRQVCGTELLAPPSHGNQPIASQDLTAATIDLVRQTGQIFSVITLDDGQEMPDFNSMGLANSHPRIAQDFVTATLELQTRHDKRGPSLDQVFAAHFFGVKYSDLCFKQFQPQNPDSDRHPTLNNPAASDPNIESANKVSSRT